MRDLLNELCALNGVSGDEGAVRDFIRAQAEPYADSIRTDALGNLIVFKKGKKSTGNRLLLAAHMDEVGLIITRATEDGFLKFDFVGGVDRRVALGKPVVLGPKKIPGVIGMKAIHMLSREDMKKVPKTEALYIDIGAPQPGGGRGDGGARRLRAPSSVKENPLAAISSRPRPLTTGLAAP